MKCNEYIDKDYIKTIIIRLRNQGKSFQEISDTLSKEYNIIRSRQAICGMYNRAISDDKITQNIDETLSIHDILHYNAIGISCERITEILIANGIDISVYKVKNILKDNQDKSAKIVSQLESLVYKLIKNGYTKEQIKDNLRYKVELPTKTALAKYIQEATIKLLNNTKIEVLGKILNQTKDIELIKVLISVDDSITFKDVTKAARKQD